MCPSLITNVNRRSNAAGLICPERRVSTPLVIEHLEVVEQLHRGLALAVEPDGKTDIGFASDAAYSVLATVLSAEMFDVAAYGRALAVHRAQRPESE